MTRYEKRAKMVSFPDTPYTNIYAFERRCFLGQPRSANALASATRKSVPCGLPTPQSERVVRVAYPSV